MCPEMGRVVGGEYSEMWRGGRMKNSSVAVGSPRKKLPFGEIDPLRDPLMPVKRISGTRSTAVNGKTDGKDVAGARSLKRGASVGSGSESGRFKLVSSKKITTTPPPKAHHHRRSPSLHVDVTATDCSSSTRTLRQSASFSGGITSTSTPRPAGARPPTPRNSPGKLARQQGSSALTRSTSSRRIPIAPHGEPVQRISADMIELEGDGRCQQGHNVQVGISNSGSLFMFFFECWL